ncbi:unnamed protein product [Rhizoctonia solani]|uniref:Uncharacterized protein n=1 Tax=Rhizoctonia solani TaxID=456999 RepID=A0A8H3E6I8_9AGAM|nr:unnamed protein product [Rhizoctonia solani]
MHTTTLRQFLGIFSPRFDNNPKVTSRNIHYHLAPEQLYRRLTCEYLPEKHIESTIVKSVWYGKTRSSARHEFILIEVEDTQFNLKNYIVLDRTPSETLARSKKIFPAKATSSGRKYWGVALDSFRVSYNGIEKQFLQECELWPRDYLEKIEFPSTEPFFLYQLAALAYVISEKSPDYVVAYRNCYWFAGLIWECMRQLQPNGVYDDRLSRNRGKFAVLRYNPGIKERDEICAAFNKEITSVENRLSESRKVCQLRRNKMYPILLIVALEEAFK